MKYFLNYPFCPFPLKVVRADCLYNFYSCVERQSFQLYKELWFQLAKILMQLISQDNLSLKEDSIDGYCLFPTLGHWP